ncbi:DNA replication and repair protein RecF [Bacteriovorax sp. BSW11_IV]|uniref:DNA replication/repair protein RecF n=1 Tax=Bacteriovorax sp. BSW11_IV TaxID=1353529 RepID=UPI00038A3053|nr:DNA replication and repair protein RecF [Bacteriovorax sp. BSW11_IV]EQC50051.1 DNA replication and repair protein RecF [Bacteriovorax sp. BSW11_IV]
MASYKISKLQVTNFRNLQPDIIEFSPQINCILGENGNGKTNILEAVYVLANKKSFRKNTSFPQYLGIDGEKPEIIFSSVLHNEDEELVSYSGKMENGSSNWYLNGQPTKRKIGINVVFINPFDSFSFHNTSSFRRNWIDTHLSMLDDQYKKTLSRYNSALKFRNTLLSKKPSKYLEQIKVIDIDFSECAKILTEKRMQFLKELNPYCGQTFQQVFSEEHKLEIVLDSRVIGLTSKNIYDMLQTRLEKDQIVGHTTYCVHKDDYVLLFDGLNSFEFCSLGQQKMSYLSLLFAYIELFRYKFRAYPIVLIDDVSGELDRFRWQKLVEHLEKSQFQVLITTANEAFKEELEKIRDAKKIIIKSGSILK